MSFDFDTLRAMYLAGRIALPSPFPAVGDLKIETIQVKLPQFNASAAASPRGRQAQARQTTAGGDQIDLELFIVRRRLDVGRSIVWAIQKDQVITFLPKDPDSYINLEKGAWVLRPLKDDAALRAAAGAAGQQERLDNGDPPRGMVFVPEDAQVVVRYESSTTAAESIEFAWDGCCGFRDGCCD